MYRKKERNGERITERKKERDKEWERGANLKRLETKKKKEARKKDKYNKIHSIIRYCYKW